MVFSNGSFCRALRRNGFSASTRHLFKDVLLVGGISFYGFHECRNEVGTAFQLNRNVAPRLVHAVAKLDERVVGGCNIQPQYNDEPDHYEQNN